MKLSQQGVLTSKQYLIQEKSLLIISKGILKNDVKEIPYEQIVMEEKFSKKQVDSSLVSVTVLASIVLIALLFSQFRIYDMMDLLGVGRASVYTAMNVGELPTYCIGKRRFCSPESLDAYVTLCEQGKATPPDAFKCGR